MVAAMVNSLTAFLWQSRANAWESAYWRDTQELEIQLRRSRQESKPQLQGPRDAEFPDASLRFADAACLPFGLVFPFAVSRFQNTESDGQHGSGKPLENLQALRPCIRDSDNELATSSEPEPTERTLEKPYPNGSNTLPI